MPGGWTAWSRCITPQVRILFFPIFFTLFSPSRFLLFFFWPILFIHGTGSFLSSPVPSCSWRKTMLFFCCYFFFAQFYLSTVREVFCLPPCILKGDVKPYEKIMEKKIRYTMCIINIGIVPTLANNQTSAKRTHWTVTYWHAWQWTHWQHYREKHSSVLFIVLSRLHLSVSGCTSRLVSSVMSSPLLLLVLCLSRQCTNLIVDWVRPFNYIIIIILKLNT